MWIDVKIPYEPDKQLAEAYNRAMKNTTADWVLLLDHDVFLCNPNWYSLCLVAIEKVPYAGMITCVTNGVHRANKTPQKADMIPDVIDDLRAHIRTAKLLQGKYGDSMVSITWPKVTGYFMLIRRAVWQEVQFQDQGEGLGYVDWDFSERLLKAGYPIYLMRGLYVLHRRGLRNLWDKL